MNKKRTSIIWEISDDQFAEIVKNSKSYKDVREYFGLNAPSNHKTIKKRIEEMDLDTSHFLKCYEMTHLKTKLTKENFASKWLQKNTEKSGTHIKKYLLKFKLLKYECNVCKNTGEHMGKPLSLQLDHINGVHNDNRLENLRFLCPNCHTQTKNWGSKNQKFQPLLSKKTTQYLADTLSYNEIAKDQNISPSQFKKHLKFYGIEKYRSDKNTINTPLRNKNAKLRNSKAPNKEDLQKLVWEKPTTEVAKMFNVSGKAVEKWCKSFDINKPPRGYWSRIKAGIPHEKALK
jgi:5-methylcytosine-specific restriction endonuclease McrA